MRFNIGSGICPACQDAAHRDCQREFFTMSSELPYECDCDHTLDEWSRADLERAAAKEDAHG